jgi:N-acetyl-anhydromuramyl-L-alanine amidase AmpD
MPIIAPRPSPNHSPRISGDPIDLVVLHATVGGFQGSLSWLRNPASEVSSHYLVSKQGDIVNLVDEVEMAWHAGVTFWRGRTDLNRYSVGIEIENLTGAKGFVGQDPWMAQQYEAVAWLVNNICERRHIPKDRRHIVTHAEIAPRRKTDPAGFDLDELMRRIGGQVVVAEPDAYFVVGSRVNVRQGPSTSYPVAAQALRGQKLYIDAIVEGETLAGNSLWAHMARRPPEQFDVGFLHSGLLRNGN